MQMPTLLRRLLSDLLLSLCVNAVPGIDLHRDAVLPNSRRLVSEDYCLTALSLNGSGKLLEAALCGCVKALDFSYWPVSTLVAKFDLASGHLESREL